ncbi:MAG: hypothetical protein LBN74_09525 [Prevotella sp.]|jgi:hypothetical protein|nr:hypothetical protein [Prevotella sp.]
MKKKQLFTLDNSPTKCPFCGNEYQQIVYYTADAEITGSYSTYSGNVKTTHTKYNYTNIQKKTGGMCEGCLTDREKHHRKMGWTLFLSALAIAVINGGILLIPLVHHIFPDIVIIILFIASTILLISSIVFFSGYTDKHYTSKKFQQTQGAVRYAYLSNEFIAMAARYYPETNYFTELGFFELKLKNGIL